MKKPRVSRLLSILLAVLLVLPCAAFGVSAKLAPADADIAKAMGLDESNYNKLKSELYAAVAAGKTDLNVSAYKISESAFEQFNNILYLNPSAIRPRIKQYYHSGDTVTSVIIKYVLTEGQEKEVVRAADALLAGIEGNSSLTDVEKALLVHDRLVSACTYDDRYKNGTEEPLSHSLYGALVSRLSVCDGYAEAYAYLLGRLGIPAWLCQSDAMLHAWNIVCLDGSLYYVDCTWDDPTGSNVGYAKHEYFLVSHDQLRRDGKHSYYDYVSTPSDTRYDNALWREYDAAFTLLGGKIYAFHNESQTLQEWNGGAPKNLLTHSSVWRATATSHWIKKYTKLVTDGTALYYNLADSVCRWVPGQTTVDRWLLPDLSGGDFRSVYGLACENGTLTLELGTEPNAVQKTVKYTLANRVPIGLTIRTAPSITEYVKGSTFIPAGMVVGLVFKDGSVGELASGYTLSGTSFTKTGSATVTVSYQGFSTILVVNVKDPASVCTVKLDPNGGLGDVMKVAATAGKTYTYPAAIFTRTGYDQLGWDLKADAKSVEYSGVNLSSQYAGRDITVYAVWARDLSVMFGDADQDGTITSKDLSLMRRYMASFDYNTGTSPVVLGEGADVNCDGEVNSKDLSVMRKYFASYDYNTGTSTVVLGDGT